jgi:dTMP kinase
MRGKLIVLEGTDGAGKSTQLNLIKKYLEGANLKYDFLHFPKYGHNEFSEVIAKFLRGEFGGVDDVDPYFVANIYAMDRYLYLPELLQKLEDNDVVLLDRYVFSNLAFQGAKLNDGGKIQKWIKDFEFGFLGLPYPNLTLFLDVPIEVVKERLKDREGEDRDYLKGLPDVHESDIPFQSIVRNVYLNLKLEQNYHIIPCAEPLMDGSWDVYPSEKLFESYKSLINLLFMA